MQSSRNAYKKRRRTGRSEPGKGIKNQQQMRAVLPLTPHGKVGDEVEDDHVGCDDHHGDPHRRDRLWGDVREVLWEMWGRDATHAVVIAPLECEVPMKLATYPHDGTMRQCLLTAPRPAQPPAVMAAVERHEKSATCSQLEV